MTDSILPGWTSDDWYTFAGPGFIRTPDHIEIDTPKPRDYATANVVTWRQGCRPYGQPADVLPAGPSGRDAAPGSAGSLGPG